MMATSYVALLRGINVGGKNLIRMTDLMACFEAHGLVDVSTYIQSGNVLFGSDEPGVTELTARVERMLSETFDYTASVALRSHEQMRTLVNRAPLGFGTQPDTYRYDIVFLMPPLSSSTALKGVALKEGVDEAQAGHGALYFSRLIERASQSKLSRLASTPQYQRMTIRNWNTTTKLLQLMDARSLE